ncbi:DUF167 domain-containing protein [Candidatus Peregrinibacteria bacterium]|nr:DUF167 domain-containing protein [Candidatus Peregrinibacteria bacterium]
MHLKLPKTGYLRIKVIPGSPKTCISEIMADETIKIRIAAPPEKNKANKELIKFLAKELKIGTERIKILSGRTEKLKLIKIEDV